MRMSTLVLALSCLVAGYALSGTRVNAKEDVSPARRFPAGIGVGTHVTLFFPSDPRSVSCTIDRIDAGWVRCAEPDDPFNKRHDEMWYDLGHVDSVMKPDTQR